MGIDTGPDINEGTEKGYIQLAVEQELYKQDYLAPLPHGRVWNGSTFRRCQTPEQLW
jgi:hypothetical protein